LKYVGGQNLPISTTGGGTNRGIRCTFLGVLSESGIR
jgi:hypothetical protein